MTEDRITGLGHRPIEFIHFKQRKKFLKRNRALETHGTIEKAQPLYQSPRRRGETECVQCSRSAETNNGWKFSKFAQRHKSTNSRS